MLNNVFNVDQVYGKGYQIWINIMAFNAINTIQEITSRP